MDAGRHRIPTAVKERQGTLEASRTSQQEPVWPQGSADPPALLAGAALEEWGRVVPPLIAQGLFPIGAVGVIAMGCWAYGQWHEAAVDIAEFGRTYTSDNGRTYAHPAVAQAGQFSNLYFTMCGRFGLDPASAGKVTARPKGEDADELARKREARRAAR